ncbi:hypothetical protein F4804DRAFT_293761 [Jackrogersella minutella]|nr:hypothetical protein F4804DRAFT_293761 [Jackrogersella minutella]
MCGRHYSFSCCIFRKRGKPFVWRLFRIASATMLLMICLILRLPMPRKSKYDSSHSLYGFGNSRARCYGRFRISSCNLATHTGGFIDLSVSFWMTILFIFRIRRFFRVTV